MFRASYDFFNLEDSIKSKYSIDIKRNAGWEKMAQIRPSTGVADLKESIQLGFHGIEDIWPTTEDAPNFRETAERFMHQCANVSKKLLKCLALGLGYQEDFFNRSHRTNEPHCLNTLRCLHYQIGRAHV